MPLSLNEYQEEALKTAIYPKEQGLAYCVLGLMSELGELNHAITAGFTNGIIKEFGDNFWYIALIAHECGFKLGDISWVNKQTFSSYVLKYLDLKENTEIIEYGRYWIEILTLNVGNLADIVKKAIRDKENILTDTDKNDMAMFLAKYLEALIEYALGLGYEPETIAKTNLEKLKSRADRGKLSGSGDNR